MARQKVIVKHLAAIQNFGSMDVLCSDKTGTLTSGADGAGSLSRAVRGAAERTFLLAYLNSAHETGIRSPLDEAILRRGRHDMPGVPKARRDPVRLRAPPPVGRAGGAGGTHPDHQGRAGADPRSLQRLRDGWRRAVRWTRAARARCKAVVRGAERERVPRPGRGLPADAPPDRVLGRGRAGHGPCRLRHVLRPADDRAPPKRSTPSGAMA